MAAFTWLPLAEPRQTLEPRVLSVTFGDGYAQRTQDGINALAATWQLSFTDKREVIESIDDFLRARGGVEAFDWTAPDGRTGRYVCAAWERGPRSPFVSTLSATFREVFGE